MTGHSRRPLEVDWAEVFTRHARRTSTAIARLLGCDPATVRRYRARHGRPAKPHGNSAAAHAHRTRAVLCEECHVRETDPEGWFQGRWLCGDCLRRGEIQGAWEAHRLALLASPVSSAGWCADAAPIPVPPTAADARDRARRVGKWARLARIMQGMEMEEEA
jgi:hypothetical protein